MKALSCCAIELKILRYATQGNVNRDISRLLVVYLGGVVVPVSGSAAQHAPRLRYRQYHGGQ